MKKAETSKGPSIWGDSGFVKAFEEAMSKYKKMHKKVSDGSPSGGAEGSVSNTEKNATHGADESDTVARMARENPGKTEIPEENPTKTKTAKTENPPPPAAKPRVDAQPAREDRGIMHDYEKHRRLVSEYNKLEERMEEISIELGWSNQYYFGEPDPYYANGGLNYQYPNEASRHYANGGLNYQYPGEAARQYAIPPYLLYYPSPTGSGSGYCCPPPDWQYNVCVGDDKTGLAAAQKGMSSLKIDAYGRINGNEGTGDGWEEATMAESETEFYAVLNSWYAAGHHTGKYLAEHSQLKKTLR